MKTLENPRKEAWNQTKTLYFIHLFNLPLNKEKTILNLILVFIPSKRDTSIYHEWMDSNFTTEPLLWFL